MGSMRVRMIAVFLTLTCAGFLPATAQDKGNVEAQSQFRSAEERSRGAAKQALYQSVAPQWKTIRALVALVDDDSKVDAFLDANPSLSDHHSSATAFSHMLKRGKGRACALPESIWDINPALVTFSFMKDEQRESILVTLRTAGTDKLLYLKCAFAGGKLDEVNVMTGFVKPLDSKGQQDDPYATYSNYSTYPNSPKTPRK